MIYNIYLISLLRNLDWIYAIIGPIGSGKTEQNILESLGYECYCAGHGKSLVYTENIIKDMRNLMPEFVLNNKVNKCY